MKREPESVSPAEPFVECQSFPSGSTNKNFEEAMHTVAKPLEATHEVIALPSCLLRTREDKFKEYRASISENFLVLDRPQSNSNSTISYNLSAFQCAKSPLNLSH